MKSFIFISIITAISSACIGTDEFIERTYFDDANSRIVGGQLAEEGQFPHQVALFRDNRFSCGGSILDKRHVLTAAHCVYHDDRM